MTIDKAIEIFIQYQKGTDLLYLPDFSDAISMGIAALSRIRYQRLKPTVPHKTLLPGETKE